MQFRLIIYFPVSALVTLFANILQNPQDPRARSDVKLMNQVVNFLSLLAVTEEQGGVKRMLHVCAEFERIARVVLEKADKDSTRRKRRSRNEPENGTVHSIPQSVPQKRHVAPATPQSGNTVSPPQTLFTPNFASDLNGDPHNNGEQQQAFPPNIQGFSPSFSDLNLPLDFANTNPAEFQSLQNAFTANDGSSPNFSSPDMTQFSFENPNGPINTSSFQQPFVPQALWQMPMTLEWDWAEMPPINGFDGSMGDGSGGGGGTTTNGGNPASMSGPHQ